MDTTNGGQDGRLGTKSVEYDYPNPHAYESTVNDGDLFGWSSISIPPYLLGIFILITVTVIFVYCVKYKRSNTRLGGGVGRRSTLGDRIVKATEERVKEGITKSAKTLADNTDTNVMVRVVKNVSGEIIKSVMGGIEDKLEPIYEEVCRDEESDVLKNELGACGGGNDISVTPYHSFSDTNDSTQIEGNITMRQCELQKISRRSDGEVDSGIELSVGFQKGIKKEMKKLKKMSEVDENEGESLYRNVLDSKIALPNFPQNIEMIPLPLYASTPSMTHDRKSISPKILPMVLDDNIADIIVHGGNSPLYEHDSLDSMTDDIAETEKTLTQKDHVCEEVFDNVGQSKENKNPPPELPPRIPKETTRKGDRVRKEKVQFDM
jgi:hypothetical protein